MDLEIPNKLAAYHRDGFLQLDTVFSLDEMRNVRQAFSDLVTAPPEGVGVIYEEGVLGVPTAVRSIMGWQRSPGVLEDFAKDHRVLTWVKRILGNDAIEFHQTKYNPKAPDIAGGEKWDPHRGDTFWCFKDGIPNPDRMMSVFIALTDQTEENGAVYAWKGSHAVTLDEIRPSLLGLDEPRELARDTAGYLSLQIHPEMLKRFNETFERISLVGSAGTVWLLSAGLLHASSRNRSYCVRELVANVFRTVDNRPAHPRPQPYLSEPANGPILL